MLVGADQVSMLIRRDHDRISVSASLLRLGCPEERCDSPHFRSVVLLVPLPVLIVVLLAEGGRQPVGQRCQFGVGEPRLGMGQ